MGHYVYVRNKKTKPGQPGHWDQKKRTEAVTTYLATGNLSLTANIINVPRITLATWKRQDWWKDLITSIRSEGAMELSSKLDKIVTKSLEAVNDRIENGEYHYDQKRGKLTRVPVKLKDLHRVATDLIDKQQIIQDREDRPVATETSLEDRLLKVAETFARNLGKEPPMKEVKEIVEGEYEDLSEHYQQELTR